MTLPLFANDELVAQAFAAEVFGTSSYIGTTLPIPDNNGTVSWYDTGFVQITTIGGSSDNLLGMNAPVMAVDCWAAPRAAGGKPPWGKANNLAEVLRNGCRLARPHTLTLPGQFPKARFFTAYFASTPRRLPDPASYAHYTFQIVVNWGPL